MRELTKKDVLAACKGGSVYASGGGAFYEHGLEMGRAALALDRVKMVSVDELPEDAIVLTCTAIGAPAGTTDWQMLGKDYIKAVQLVMERYEGKIVGVMTPQNGKSSSTNGWLPAAALGLVVVDATGDIRAHPTGKMGAMGKANDLSYHTIQAVAGGKKEKGNYMELVVEGTAARTSKILRIASDLSGGFIAAARHPLTAGYIKEHAAVGGLSKAIDLGNAIIDAEPDGAEAVIQAICRKTKGEILIRGKVTEKDMHYTDEAFDIGTITVSSGERSMILHVMNEYMAVDNEHHDRVATFPDVIVTFSAADARPLSTNEVQPGMELVVFKIDKSHLPLSSSVKDPSVYPEVEEALDIKLYDFAFPNKISQ